MIYIITVHWRSVDWIVTQESFIRRSLGGGVSVLRGVSPDILDQARSIGIGIQHQLAAVSGRHAANLDFLATRLESVCEANDTLLFLDGDALPLGASGSIEADISEVGLIAARRLENMGDSQPHPLFCGVRADIWFDNNLSWAEGPTRLGEEGYAPASRIDVGGKLLERLDKLGIAWVPLDRSNLINPHPLWFGVYGDHVYHHGAAFRRPWSQLDRERAYGSGRRRLQLGRVDEALSKIPMAKRLSRRYRIEGANSAEMAQLTDDFLVDPAEFIARLTRD